MPGLGGGGAAGWAGKRLCCRRATMAGLGGTTGRAAGCPARFGRICARKGTFGDGVKVDASAGRPGGGAGGRCGALGGRGGAGRTGANGVPGRGARGIAAAGTAGICTLGAEGAGRAAGGGCGSGGGASAAGGLAGSGCLGPDKICPGFGAGGPEGTGLAGIGVVRAAV